MNKIKKGILGAGTTISILAPTAIIISCGNENTSENWHGSHRDVVVYLPTQDGENPLYGRPNKIKTPISYIPSSQMAEASNSMQFGLFSLVKQGIDKFEEFEENKSINSQVISETKIKSHANRLTKLTFEAIKQVVLIYKDNSEKTFDSDSLDEKDNNSINSQAFKNALAKTDENGISQITNIKFVFKDDLNSHHWIQQITGKQGASIKAEDFWTSIQYQIMSNDQSRDKKGGSDAINEYVNSITKSEMFQSKKESVSGSTWLNSEITFGLSRDQFDIDKKEEFIKDGGKAINYRFTGKQRGISMTSFWKQIELGGGLKAMPTQVFKDLKQKYPVEKKVFENDADFEEYQKSDLAKTGVVEFNSAQNDSDYYVAGKYYMSKNDKKKAVYTQNKDYINSYWLNLKNESGKKVTLNKYTIEFIQESKLQDTIIQKAFEQGFSVTGSKDGMSNFEYQKALSDPKKYGIKNSTGYTSAKLLGDYSSIQFLPNSPNPWKLENNKPSPGNSNFLVFFNNNYAKVMWGKNIKDLHEDQSNEEDSEIHGDWANHAFAGTGMQFITNLLAAQNWFTAIKNYDIRVQESTTALPPEGPINGKKSGQDFLVAHPPFDPQTLIEKLHNRLRSRIGMDFLDDKSHQELEKPIPTEVTRSEYQKIYSQKGTNALNRYGAPPAKLTKYKQNIAEALDKAGIKQDEKVTWEISIGRGLTSTTRNPIYKKLQEFIRTLDPRLNPVAKMNPYKEDGTVPIKEVIQKDYDISFSLSDKASGSFEWFNRINQGGIGYNASSLNLASDYEVNSIAGGIYRQIGFLQSGFLLALSYYADHPKLLEDEDNPLKGLKVFINSFENSKKETFLKNKDWKKEFNSTQKQKFIKSLEAFKFKKLWDNPSSVIASYDYAGMNGFGKVRKIKVSKEGLESEDIKKDLDTFSNLFNRFLKNAQYDLDQDIQNGKIDDKDLLEAAIAYNIIQPGSMNPFEQQIGNRDYPSIKIEKKWYESGGTNVSSYSDISWARVDSDEDIYLK